MVSIEGKFIKRLDNGNNGFTYTIDRNSQLDSSLILMAANVLPLCENHDKVQIFISKYSTFDRGVIFQALANALKSIRRDYVVAVNSMDQEYQKGNYTLQRLWYDCQKPAKGTRGD